MLSRLSLHLLSSVARLTQYAFVSIFLSSIAPLRLLFAAGAAAASGARRTGCLSTCRSTSTSGRWRSPSCTSACSQSSRRSSRASSTGRPQASFFLMTRVFGKSLEAPLSSRSLHHFAQARTHAHNTHTQHTQPTHTTNTQKQHTQPNNKNHQKAIDSLKGK